MIDPLSMSGLVQKRCVPCEGGAEPLSRQRAEELMKELSEGWMLIDDAHLIAKHFHFKDFKQTMAFVNRVASIAEEEGHHPDLSVSYADLDIELSTHAVGGLSENDFILAVKIDAIA